MKKITADELRQMMDERKDALKLFDARGDQAFEDEHLPHAKSVPESALRERVEGVVDKQSEIIVYCTDPDCTASVKAGERLEEMGYQNVARFEAGIEGWKRAGHETVTS